MATLPPIKVKVVPDFSEIDALAQPSVGRIVHHKTANGCEAAIITYEDRPNPEVQGNALVYRRGPKRP